MKKLAHWNRKQLYSDYRDYGAAVQISVETYVVAACYNELPTTYVSM